MSPELRSAATSDELSVIVRAEGLVKTYAGRRVVDQLSMSCAKGRILTLLGPNGAGKTTTLRMLYGLIEPDQGRVFYEGLELVKHRANIKRWVGVCTQDDTVDYDLSVVENLRVYAGYFRPKVESLETRIENLLQLFELQSYRDRSPRTLSGGYRQRLQLARSIVHSPRVLYLDEPTTGLDPSARVQVWELIHRLRGEGLSIILTTHYMEEAERLSDDLVVIDRGRSLSQGAPREVLGKLLGEHVVVVPPDSKARAEVEGWAERELEREPSVVLGELRIPLPAAKLAAFAAEFENAGFQVRPPNLDDLFLQLSKGSRSEQGLSLTSGEGRPT